MLDFYNLNNILPLNGNEYGLNSALANSTLSSSIWYYDDFTERGHYVLNHQFIIFVLVFNILYHIGIYYYNHKIKTWKKIEENSHLFNALLNIEDSADRLTVPLLSKMDDEVKDNYGSTEHDSEVKQIKESHFSIFHLKQNDDETASYQVVVERSKFDYFRLYLEVFIVNVLTFGNVFYHYFYSKNTFVVNLILNAAMFLNVNFRCFKNSNNYNYYINVQKLWGLSLINYIFTFTLSAINFRSFIIHSERYSPLENKFFFVSFILNSILLLNSLTSRIKNNLPVLFYEHKTAADGDSDDEENEDVDERLESKLLTPSPEPVTSVLSFAYYSFLDPFIWLSHTKFIKFSEIWSLSKEDHALNVLSNFKIFTKKKNSDYSHFSRDVILFFTKYLVVQVCFSFLNSCITFVPTVLLRKILEYVSDPSILPKNVVWLYIIFMLLAKIICAALSGQCLFYGRRVCVRIRAIIISEVYAKALRRKISVQHAVKDDEQEETENGDEEEIEENATLGGIINLMSVDAFKVSEVCAYLYAFVESVTMTVVAMTLLYKLIGFASVIGATLILILSPINYKLMNYIGVYQNKSLSVTDKRIQKLNETFNNIRIIKFFSWEENFINEIMSIREEELHLLLVRSYIWALSTFVWCLTPSIISSCAFAFYTYYQGNQLSVSVAFTALSLFAMLKGPLEYFSDMASFVIQAKVSLDRIQKFLNEPESAKYDQLTVSDTKLGFEDVVLSWSGSDEKTDENSENKNKKDEADFQLQNLNIDFKIGKLNLVVGETGSGKTSLLMGLLGEMNLQKGTIYVPSINAKDDLVVDPNTNFTRSIAYCSQSAWLLNDTVRNNILFSEPFDKERYDAVIDACGLTRDLEILVGGDQTEIGEKGLSLSGGQKQRVSLARALYSKANTLLLDDCLSAVDSHNALWIYENCITGDLMKNRTCVLVSHNIALTLKRADWCVLMENGKVKGQGPPLDLFNQGLLGDDDLLKNSILSASSNHLVELNVEGSEKKHGIDLSKLGDNKDGEETADGENAAIKKPVEVTDESKKSKGKLVQSEGKSDGVVKLEVYAWYIKVFGGIPIVLALCSVFMVANSITILQAWWMRNWASSADSIKAAVSYVVNDLSIKPNKQDSVLLNSAIHFANTPGSSLSANVQSISAMAGHGTIYYISIYFGIGALFAVISSFKVIATFVAGCNASRKMFNIILDNVMFAKLRFFDTTPIGRIMNRFSKDIESVDQDLAPFVELSFNSLVQCFSTIILIAWITPVFLIGAVIIGSMYYALGYFYSCGSRELKRFDSITKSPIMQHFSETLVGISTIRAYGDERRFIKENLVKIDTNNKPFFYLWVANRWLAARIDIIGAFVTFFAGASILLQIDSIDAGLAGISLTYAITFTESALWVVRMYSNVEMCMNSVERLKEYTDIEQEPLNLEAPLPEEKNWPSQGSIELNDLSLRYAPNLPKVIKHITFTVKPETSVAVVGRTGAGKSSLLSALFLFLLPETGYVKIDGVDITSIPLKKLRQSIGIIPQDPQMFTGTIKTNLDPYDEFSDEQIFESLRRVNLINKEELSSLKSNNYKKIASKESSSSEDDTSNNNVNKFLNLNNAITEGGSNISQGQRQLICLARTLLRQPKVILLDEATASLDYKSDQIIQQTVREEFSNCTIMTIAHRLKTVIDYDKIVVLDNGLLKEYDHPYSLLLNKDSIFYSMCEDSGELDTLLKLAKEAFVKQLNSS